jgi:hypothetical protein
VICEVCSAPALRLEEACVFCRSPLDPPHEIRTQPPRFHGDPGDDTGSATFELLEYLGYRVPGARARRRLVGRGRGRVTTLSLLAGGELFRARIRAEQLELWPELELELWVDRLLASLSRDAAGQPEVRHAVSRSGWRMR